MSKLMVLMPSNGIKSTSKGPVPKSLAFELSSGPTPRTKREKTPMNVFQSFITTLLLEGIIKESNNYASDKGVKLDLQLEELMAFIGMNIAMGMMRLPQIRDYWAIDEMFSTPMVSCNHA